MFAMGSTNTINVDQFSNGILTSQNYPNPAGSQISNILLGSTDRTKVIKIYITDLYIEDSLE
jgi:hypothetical protein